MTDLQGADTATPVLIETTSKGKSSLPSVYMEAAVREIIPTYGSRVRHRRVEVTTAPGKKRFLELSCALFGEEAVYKYHRIAPLPALFINGELCFDAIPPGDELAAAIEAHIDAHHIDR